MTTFLRKAAVAVFVLTLSGCEETPKQSTTTTTATTTRVTTTQTTRAVALTIGMKGSDAIALAGIPCNAATLKSINDGNNVTVNYGGNSYVFGNGVLTAVR